MTNKDISGILGRAPSPPTCRAASLIGRRRQGRIARGTSRSTKAKFLISSPRKARSAAPDPGFVCNLLYMQAPDAVAPLGARKRVWTTVRTKGSVMQAPQPSISGTRDYAGDDAVALQTARDAIEATLRLYAYAAIDPPILESPAPFLNRSGEDIRR